jgi:hypothetical protein
MKRKVNVIQVVEVEVDESKFTDEFLSEWQETFYPFTSVNDHILHIAQLEARSFLDDFTEGYGKIEEFGISAKVVDQVEEFV